MQDQVNIDPQDDDLSNSRDNLGFDDENNSAEKESQPNEFRFNDPHDFDSNSFNPSNEATEANTHDFEQGIQPSYMQPPPSPLSSPVAIATAKALTEVLIKIFRLL